MIIGKKTTIVSTMAMKVLVSVAPINKNAITKAATAKAMPTA